VLFDVLAPPVASCRLLDVFAGCGAVGFEALSRGAAHVAFVEGAPAAVAALRENARALAGCGGEVRILRQDALVALGALAERAERFDLVFLDPPYSEPCEPVLREAASLVAPGGLLVAQHFKKRELPETIGRLRRSRLLRVGDASFSLYAPAEGPGGEA
jgi:16S rRNA (guanine(966)-N(2))-methyltransferase RsmD